MTKDKRYKSDGKPVIIGLKTGEQHAMLPFTQNIREVRETMVKFLAGIRHDPELVCEILDLKWDYFKEHYLKLYSESYGKVDAIAMKNYQNGLMSGDQKYTLFHLKERGLLRQDTNKMDIIEDKGVEVIDADELPFPD